MKELKEKILKRIIYIQKKLECCSGYSSLEKKARIEELNGIIKYLELKDGE